MTTAYWCVLIAAILPYLFALIAKIGGAPFDNNNPRAFLENTEGKQKRAHWTQLNSFEAFPAFAAAVIIAHLTGSAQATIDNLAMAFILFRILYGVFYIYDQATLRSVVWAGGFACTIALFLN